MAVFFRRLKRIKRRGRALLFGRGANVILAAAPGAYSLTGNNTLSTTALLSESGSYTLNGSAASSVVVLAASAGSYSLTGVATAALSTLTAQPGAYALNGNPAGGASEFVAEAGAYTLTGSAATLDPALLASAGSYTITGNDAAFPIVWRVEGGSYTIVPGESELRRTGYDYPPDYYGIGHYLEEIQRLKQLNAITRKVPPPIIREVRANIRPIAAPQVAQQPAQVLDLQAIMAGRAALQAEQERQQQEAISTQRRKQDADFLLLAAY